MNGPRIARYGLSLAVLLATLPAHAESADETAALRQPYRALVIGTTATGIASVGLGIASQLFARDRLAELKEQCAGNICPPSARGTVDEGRTFTTVATGAFITAGVSFAALAVFLIAAPRSTVTAATAGALSGRF